MAVPVVGAQRRTAASGRIVTLGFVYPDAIDIRTALPRGYGPVRCKGAAPRSSGARPGLTPDPGPANEPTAPQPRS